MLFWSFLKLNFSESCKLENMIQNFKKFIVLHCFLCCCTITENFLISQMLQYLYVWQQKFLITIHNKVWIINNIKWKWECKTMKKMKLHIVDFSKNTSSTSCVYDFVNINGYTVLYILHFYMCNKYTHIFPMKIITQRKNHIVQQLTFHRF